MLLVFVLGTIGGILVLSLVGCWLFGLPSREDREAERAENARLGE